MAYSDLPPRFFKVFISQFSSESMMIPLSYYDELPSHLPKTAKLQGTGGCMWEVAMKKNQDEVHFEEGWVKFVKDNALVDGDFLTFVFNGDCAFEVSVYGLDGYKETRAVAEDENDKVDGAISLSSGSESEVADTTLRSKNKGKAKVEVVSKEEAVESSDEDSDSDYVVDFGRLDVVSEDSSYEISHSTNSHDKTAIVKTTKKIVSTQKRKIVRPKIKNPEAYMDNPDNAYLVTGVKNKKQELLVNSQVLHDCELKFGNHIVYKDEHGKLKAKAKTWRDQRVCIKKWHQICKRNNVTKKDLILCEFLRRGKVVKSVKVHIIRNRLL